MINEEGDDDDTDWLTDGFFDDLEANKNGNPEKKKRTFYLYKPLRK